MMSGGGDVLVVRRGPRFCAFVRVVGIAAIAYGVAQIYMVLRGDVSPITASSGHLDVVYLVRGMCLVVFGLTCWRARTYGYGRILMWTFLFYVVRVLVRPLERTKRPTLG